MANARGSLLENPRAPAAILAIGDAIWAVIAWLGNFDFIMSMQEEKIAMIFEALLKWGWLIILGYAILRYLSKPRRANRWEMVAYVGVLTFMTGVLLGTWASGSVPTVVVAWGANANGCKVTVDTRRLMGYSNRFKLAVACGINDPKQDFFEDKRIAVSGPYMITGDRFDVIVMYKGTFMKGIPSPENHIASEYVFLFPKDEDPKVIKQLSEIKKYGGTLLLNGPS